MKWSGSVSLLLAVFLGACVSASGEFKSTGYAPPRYDYLVRYADASSKRLMPKVWELDNLYKVGSSWHQKKGADYQVKLYRDVDSDGQEDDLGDVPIYDLRFRDEKNDGAIWVRTIPLESDGEHMELRVLLDNIVDDISGSGKQTFQLEGSIYVGTKSHRYAARVLQRSSGRLAGRRAYAETVDVVDLDRRKVEPDSIAWRMMLVLVRTPFVYKANSGNNSAELPVVLLAGYGNRPRDFAASLPDFRALLGRIEVKGRVGFTVAPLEPTVGGSVAPPVHPSPAPSKSAQPPPAAQDAGPEAASASSPGAAEAGAR